MIFAACSIGSDPPPLIVSDQGAWQLAQLITRGETGEYQDLLIAEPALVCWAFLTEGSGKLRSLQTAAQWLHAHVDLLLASATNEGIAESQRAALVDRLTRSSAAAKAFRSDEDQFGALLAYLASHQKNVWEIDRFEWLQNWVKSNPIDHFSPDEECLQRWRYESWVVNDAAIEVFQRLLHSRQVEGDFQKVLEVEKLASLRQLAYGASHEVNNPLANIATRAQTLLREEAHPDRSRALMVIYEQAMRAHEMISNMMVYAHPPVAEPASCDAHEIVAQVIAELGELAERERATITHDTRCELPAALIDSTQFAMAIKAVLQNSIEASPVRGKVEVSLKAASHALMIYIQNNGPIIEPEVRRHIFDPFFSGREAGRGLGFGLSTARVLLEQNNANIEYQIDEHGGRFVITTPVDG